MKLPYGKRVCPYFLACDREQCVFRAPVLTHVKIGYCYVIPKELEYKGPLPHGFKLIEGMVLFELIDVDGD